MIIFSPSLEITRNFSKLIFDQSAARVEDKEPIGKSGGLAPANQRQGWLIVFWVDISIDYIDLKLKAKI